MEPIETPPTEPTERENALEAKVTLLEAEVALLTEKLKVANTKLAEQTKDAGVSTNNDQQPPKVAVQRSEIPGQTNAGSSAKKKKRKRRSSSRKKKRLLSTSSYTQSDDDSISQEYDPDVTLPNAYPFESIVNWRHIGGFVVSGGDKPISVRQCKIYRSATPATGSSQDIQYLLENLHVNTLLDLRADSEMIENEKASALKQSVKACSKIVRQPIYGRQFMIKGVLGGASLSAKMSALGSFLAGNYSGAKRAIVSHMNEDGLAGLYVLFLEHCKAQLLKALSVFLDPAAYPVHLFCNAGKDRTGLVVALVLVAVGVKQADICRDYSRTQQADFSKHKAFESTLQKNGLKEEFMDAPYDVMERTFQYLDTTYGSPLGYLDRIGFGSDKRDRLCSILLDGVPEYEHVDAVDTVNALQTLPADHITNSLDIGEALKLNKSQSDLPSSQVNADQKQSGDGE